MGRSHPPLLILPLMFSLPFFGNTCGPQEQGLSREQKVIDVVVTHPKIVEINREVTGQGVLVASETLVVKAPQAGTLIRSYVREGDQVGMGDPLFTFDEEPIRLQQEKKLAEMKEVQANIDLLQEELRILAEGGTPSAAREFLDEDEGFREPRPWPPAEGLPVGNNRASSGPWGPGEEEEAEPQEAQPQDDVGRIKAQSELALATLERMRTELNILDEALAHPDLTAAIAGVVDRLQVTEGSQVGAGEELARIVALDPLTIDFSVSQDVAPFIDKKLPLKVFPDALHQKIVGGDITFISPEVDVVLRALTLKAHIPNPDLALKSQQTVDYALITRQVAHVLALPATAITKVGGKEQVVVVMEERPLITGVRTGQALEGGMVEVEGNIRQEDLVVLEGMTQVGEGDLVNVVEAREAAGP